MYLWSKLLLGTSCAATLGLVAANLVPTRMTGLDESPLDAYGVALALTGTEANASPEPILDVYPASGPPAWLFGTNARAERVSYADYQDDLAFTGEEDIPPSAPQMIDSQPFENVAEAAENTANDVQQAEIAEPETVGPAVLVTAPVQDTPVVIRVPPLTSQ